MCSGCITDGNSLSLLNPGNNAMGNSTFPDSNR